MLGPKADNKIEGGSHNQQAGTIHNHGLTFDQHVKALNDAKAELRADLEEKYAALKRANEAEKGALRKVIELLNTQIAEYANKLASPQADFEAAKKRIAELEALLERSGNEIGGDRIAEARTALERGDFSLADALFAEIEERRRLEVAEAARAAFGRGEIAEAEIRWADAADHYTRAARLDPTYDCLIKAGDLSWRAAGYRDAIRHFEQLLEVAKSEFGESDPKTATAMNNLAEGYRAAGRYAEAEQLYRDSLLIGHKVLGPEHAKVAQWMRNLAWVLEQTSHFAEAEQLYREVLEIGRRTLTLEHPQVVSCMNNLADLLRAGGRLAEAEQLYWKAIEIGRKRVGFPADLFVAIWISRLGGFLKDIGRFTEAEQLYREALEIHRKALGAAHPALATDMNNLAGILENTDRFTEAKLLYREALEIHHKELGVVLPLTRTIAENYLAALLNHRPDASEIPELQALLAQAPESEGEPDSRPPARCARRPRQRGAIAVDFRLTTHFQSYIIERLTGSCTCAKTRPTLPEGPPCPAPRSPPPLSPEAIAASALPLPRGW